MMKFDLKKDIYFEFFIVLLVNLAFLWDGLLYESFISLVMTGSYITFYKHHRRNPIAITSVIWVIMLFLLAGIIVWSEVYDLNVVIINNIDKVNYSNVDIWIIITLLFSSLYIFISDLFKEGIK